VAVLVLLAVLALAVVGGPNRLHVGGLFAYSRDGVVYLEAADGTGSVPVAREPGYYFDTGSWSPDGRLLAIDKFLDGRFPDADPSEAGVLVLDPTTVVLRRVGPGWFAGWTANGAGVVTGSDAGGFTMYDLGSGRSREIMDTSIEAMALSPDGRWIAAMKGHSLIRVNVASGEVIQLYDNGGEMVDGPAWSPDSTRIAFARTLSPQCHTCRGPILVMSSDGSNQIVVSPPTMFARSPVWSPDGRLLAYMSSTGIEVVRSDGTEARQLVDLGPDEQAAIPYWSPDGTTIRYLSGSLEETMTRYAVWEVSVAGGQPRRIDDGSGAEGFAWQSLAADASVPPIPSLRP
jgi:Tol biopolymer transport system component